MPVPIVFRGGGDYNINFDFQDAIERTGYIRFYGFGTCDSTARDYFLTREASYCGTVNHTTAGNGTYASGVEPTSFDIDFDTGIFDTSLTVGGTFICNIPYGVSAVDATPTGYMECYVYHVTSGGTETELLHLTGPSIAVGAETHTDLMFSAAGTIANKLFNKGEKLRVTVHGHVGAAGNSSTVAMGHDPQNAAYTGGGVTLSANHTLMQVFMPFRINL